MPLELFRLLFVTDEWFRSFFAARTPGHADLFGEQARPIDIFPRLFGAYLDEPLPLADGRRFTSIHGLDWPLTIEEWTGTASR